MTTTDPNDVSMIAIARRPHEAYNPEVLKYEIADLLRAKGLHPELPENTNRAIMAGTAASDLLRAFGILPAGGPEVIDRPNAPDPESR